MPCARLTATHTDRRAIDAQRSPSPRSAAQRGTQRRSPSPVGSPRHPPRAPYPLREHGTQHSERTRTPRRMRSLTLASLTLANGSQ
ncbi:hypothetical protein SEA_BRAXOADDIE_96 [Rhodococcus phage Braxoaddie]|nr:hypothetical protein SEA_BRAXOADDIE_96 [Rhodococcus phage Braxoaddie]